MKRFVIAVALTCVLSGTVLAGDAHSVDAPAPPPSPVVTAILTIIRIVAK